MTAATTPATGCTARSEVWSIGGAVSSGCVRLLNQDVIDLFGRVPVDTIVVVNA